MNIAKAFLNEIKAHENFLSSSLNDKYLENNETPSSFNLIQHSTNHLHWHYPFYDNFDLFSTSRMSIFCLDETLCEMMNIFYDNLCRSDDFRREFNNHIEKNPHDDIGNTQKYKETIEALNHTFEPVSQIKKGLEDIISMNEPFGNGIFTNLEIPKWGIIGWIQFVVQLLIILFGAGVAITTFSLIGIGLAYIAIGLSLAVTQINAYKSSKMYILQNNMQQQLNEMQKQLDRIEKK